MACERREASDVNEKKVSFHCKRVSCGVSTYWMWEPGRRATLLAIDASKRSSRWWFLFGRSFIFRFFEMKNSEVRSCWFHEFSSTDRTNERTTSTKGWPVCFSPLFSILFEFNTHQFPLYFFWSAYTVMYTYLKCSRKKKNQSEHHFVVVL